ncbi:flagellar outer dynein arm light chain 2 [Thecamonas trahens ATCC 50062]|uniref:Flagellar outer dynein arm light chain 2 n=1 Tax=Thecamonas trahens ATCC 50062 TaxID=461836 RepID=A0A0L0DN17_THETB|nr:flagellar outer dynein arm light chain 2 [Thecamonas trahens ATCC 50062]KNC53421.1 flagellar outer dynein arm light chain 2 [Thecamonas trahens ATCC 50062]|eukprot:XP_013754459.1 flagellar outer dynein arm light chain 2 [Thecamonas trahens ATCC 50062]
MDLFEGSENTYQLGPHEGQKYVVDETLEAWLGDKEYEAAAASKWTVELTQVVEEAVREMEFPRYKIVVQVVLGENKGQGINTVSRCLWSVETDGWASSSYKNASIFCTAMVFGVYFE